MERKFVDVGHRVDTPSESDPTNITHAATGNSEVGTTVGEEVAKGGSEAVQAIIKKAAAAVGNGIQERRNEVITYARREPMTALMAAAGFGFAVGLALAIGSRTRTSGRGAWLPQLKSRGGLLGRRTESGWRGFLRLE